MEEIERLSGKKNDLVYYFKSKSAQKYFIRFIGPLILYNNKMVI